MTTASIITAVTGTTSDNFTERNINISRQAADSISQSTRQERGNAARRGTSDSSNRKRGNHKKR